MTPKQQKFVDEYLIDLNATQAAIRAGYSKKTAYSIGEENLRKPEIKQFLQERMKERENRLEISQDRVLKELARIAFFDLRKLYDENGNLKDVTSFDDDVAAVVTQIDTFEEFEGYGEEREQIGVVRKVKVNDKGQALTLAMRHLGMFNDKLSVTIEDEAELIHARRKTLLGGD